MEKNDYLIEFYQEFIEEELKNAIGVSSARIDTAGSVVTISTKYDFIEIDIRFMPLFIKVLEVKFLECMEVGIKIKEIESEFISLLGHIEEPKGYMRKEQDRKPSDREKTGKVRLFVR